MLLLSRSQCWTSCCAMSFEEPKFWSRSVNRDECFTDRSIHLLSSETRAYNSATLLNPSISLSDSNPVPDVSVPISDTSEMKAPVSCSVDPVPCPVIPSSCSVTPVPMPKSCLGNSVLDPDLHSVTQGCVPVSSFIDHVPVNSVPVTTLLESILQII
jgi:hypothetical protein